MALKAVGCDPAVVDHVGYKAAYAYSSALCHGISCVVSLSKSDWREDRSAHACMCVCLRTCVASGELFTAGPCSHFTPTLSCWKVCWQVSRPSADTSHWQPSDDNSRFLVTISSVFVISDNNSNNDSNKQKPQRQQQLQQQSMNYF